MSGRTLRLLAAGVLGLGLVFAGCSSKDASKNDTGQTGMNNQLSDETQQSMQQFQANMQTQLDAMDKDVQALQAQVATLSGQAKDEAQGRIDLLQKQLADLRTQAQNMHQNMMQMMGSNSSAWDEMQSNMHASMDHLSQGINAAKKDLMPGMGMQNGQ